MTHKNDGKNDNKHLFYLSELTDYKVASNDQDVRGWPVKDADNRVIGKVDNLLVNKTTERVVYLDVEVDKTIIDSKHDPYQSSSSEVHEFINKDGENHLIVPVGLVSLNEDQNFVYTDKVNHQTFAETKRFEKGSNLNREYEVVVLESYGRNRGDHRDSERDLRDRDYRNSDVHKTGSTFGDSDRSSDSLGNTERRDSSFRDSERVSNRDTSLTDSERNSTFRNSDRDQSYRDNDRTDNDFDRRDRDESYRTGGETGRKDDDDFFYNRREFDNSNWRRRS